MKIPASKDTGTEAYKILYAVLGRIYGASHLLSLERNAYTSRRDAPCQGKTRIFPKKTQFFPPRRRLTRFPG